MQPTYAIGQSNICEINFFRHIYMQFDMHVRAQATFFPLNAQVFLTVA